MTARAQELRRRILEIQAQEAPRRRYDAGLKRAVVAYHEEREQAGARMDAVAGELGLPLSTLSKWVRHARRRLAAGKVPFARLARPPLAWPPEPEGEGRPAAGDTPAPPPVQPVRPVKIDLEDDTLQVRVVLDAVDMDTPTRERLGAWLLVRGADED